MHCKERDNHPSEHIDFARYLQKLFHLLIALKAIQQLLLGHDQRNCIFNLLLCIFLFYRSFIYLSNTPTCWYWDSSANQIISVVAFPTSATSQKYKSHESSLFCTNQIGRSSTKLLKKSATESSRTTLKHIVTP